MVRNLLKKTSAPFVVWNRSAEACSQLASEFPDRVTVAATPKDVVSSAATTYCMLSTAEASTAVVRTGHACRREEKREVVGNVCLVPCVGVSSSCHYSFLHDEARTVLSMAMRA